MYLLGYDIGSSSIKVALVHAESQEVVKIVQHPEQEMEMIARQSGWAEQQPEIWWQYLSIATKKLLKETGVSANKIKGIGIAYQMHGLVLIDKDQRVLRPAIIWCDSRAVEIGHQAYNKIGDTYCQNNLLNALGNFTASKLKWVKDNEPDIYEKIHKILLPGDYIAMKLTGQAMTTISGLTEGVFWDFKEKAISKEVLDFFQFDEDIIADLTPTFSLQGKVTKIAAEITGLKSGTPITYRAGDQPNNALALNVLAPGEVAATSGTSGVAYGIVDHPIFDKNNRINTFAHVNYEEQYNRLGALLCLNGAGIAYSWVKHQIARKEHTYEVMDRMISTVPIGADGLCVLPFGNGAERIFDNKNLNAHFLNLQFNRHHRGHMYRSAIEGVAFSFVYGINLLKEMGMEVEVIRVGNDNMFQSKTFAMTIATLLDCHIEVVDTTGAVGAAQAAGVKAGYYATIEEALQKVQPSHLYEPKLNKALCNQAFNFWCSNLSKIQQSANPSHKTPAKIKAQQTALIKEIKEKDKQVLEKSNQLIEAKDLLDTIKNTLATLAKKEKVDQKAIIRQLTKKIDQQTNKKEWDFFENHLDLLQGDLYKRLKQVFPSLTATDIKFCVFLKMQLSSKEIAERLHLSIRGVETRRYRLRKKLKLKKGANLITFLERF